MDASRVHSTRRLAGGLLLGVAALVLALAAANVEGADRLAVAAVVPALALVALVSLAIGIGHPRVLLAHRDLVTKSADTVAVLGMLVVSIASFASEPSPRQAIHVFRWTLPAILVVAIWAYYE